MKCELDINNTPPAEPERSQSPDSTECEWTSLIVLGVLFVYGIFSFGAILAGIPDMGALVILGYLLPFVMIVGNWAYLVTVRQACRYWWVLGCVATLSYVGIAIAEQYLIAHIWTII